MDMKEGLKDWGKNEIEKMTQWGQSRREETLDLS